MGNHSKNLLLMLDVELELVAEPLCLCILNISIFPYKKNVKRMNTNPQSFTFKHTSNRIIE